MFCGQVAGQSRLGAEGLGEKDCRNIRIIVEFEFQIVRCLVFHTACPAVDMGGVRKEAEQGKIPWRNSPEAGHRFTGLQAVVGGGGLHGGRDGLHLF